MADTTYLEQADAFIAKLDAMPDAEIPAEPTAVVPTPTFRTAFAEEVENACDAATAACAKQLEQSHAARDAPRTRITDLQSALSAQQATNAALEEKVESLEAEVASVRLELVVHAEVAGKAEEFVASLDGLREAVK